MSARPAVVADLARCPWTTRGWWLLGGAATLALGLSAVGALVLGSLWVLAAAGLAVGVGALVVGTVLSEDRATGIGVHEPSVGVLTVSWSRARRAARLLRRTARQLPAGPLHDAVDAEAAALRRHLHATRVPLVAWWREARRVDRLDRAGGDAVAARAELVRAADEIVCHLDALAASADRLRAESERRAGLDRVTALGTAALPMPALPSRNDRLDSLAAALAELAALDEQAVTELARPTDAAR
jgi:hypothetical protein